MATTQSRTELPATRTTTSHSPSSGRTTRSDAPLDTASPAKPATELQQDEQHRHRSSLAGAAPAAEQQKWREEHTPSSTGETGQ